EGNCFTQITDAARLASIADTLADKRTIERLNQVCERWIYSTCLCFALDNEEQERTGFHYAYSIYQAEYSRNLLFQRGAQMEAGLSAYGRSDPQPTGCTPGEDTVWHRAAAALALETSTSVRSRARDTCV
ncbi:MAG: hypothetical protein M3069_21105, partial [Chloroflexota bacterium]|nr:hypothetical protein [Chloroflexota bacterium]